MLPFQLRPLTADDLDALVELDRDPEVMRFINGGQPTPRALYVELLLPRMLAAATRPGLGFFAIESAEAGFLGWVHLRLDSFEPSWAELGYRLARPFWGQGVATGASRVLARRLFPGRVRVPSSWLEVYRRTWITPGIPNSLHQLQRAY